MRIIAALSTKLQHILTYEPRTGRSGFVNLLPSARNYINVQVTVQSENFRKLNRQKLVQLIPNMGLKFRESRDYVCWIVSGW